MLRCDFDIVSSSWSVQWIVFFLFGTLFRIQVTWKDTNLPFFRASAVLVTSNITFHYVTMVVLAAIMSTEGLDAKLCTGYNTKFCSDFDT